MANQWLHAGYCVVHVSLRARYVLMCQCCAMQEYCARVRFHPPLAAEAPNVGGRSADLQAGTATKRRKSGMAVAADDAVAAAAAAAKGYEAKVDGNVVDLPSGFRYAAFVASTKQPCSLVSFDFGTCSSQTLRCVKMP